MTATLRRRDLLRTGLLVAGAASFGPAFWRSAYAAAPATPGPGPYGPLQPADDNGIELPKGFSSRVVARGLVPVGVTGYVWHLFSDGQATYATPDGGWILVSNSEVPGAGQGGASALRFGPDGEIADAYRILSGTDNNCSGGATPWGTWMSCEENDSGTVWECDPTGTRDAVEHPAMGVFSHEAVAVDPEGQRLYLTEDDGDGGFYRFTPDAYPDCSAGLLEVAVVPDGRVRWVAVPDPSAASAPTRSQVPGMTKFKRGEGIFFDAGMVYVATTSDFKVHAYDTVRETLEVVYDGKALPEPPISDPDNLTVSRSGDVFVCEDPGTIGIGLVTPDRVAAPFLRVTGEQHTESETTGVVFDPSGRRLYFSSQRGFGTGVIYEISGPFRQERVAPPLGTATAGSAPPAGTTPTQSGPAATVGPALGVEAPRRLSLARLRRRGLAVRLTLDGPATVTVTLRARLAVRGRRRTVVLGRARKVVASAGPEAVTLRLSDVGRRRLRGRRASLRAQVVVTVAGRDGARRSVERSVVLAAG